MLYAFVFFLNFVRKLNNMRNPKLFQTALLLLLTVFLLSNCKKDKQTEVYFEYPLFFVDNMEMDTLNVNSMVERETYDFPTSLESVLSSNNTDKKHIKSAKLIAMRIQILDYALADSINWCNIQDISEIYADIRHSLLGTKTVAFKMVPDTRVAGINFEMTGVELKEYLQQDYFRMAFRYKKRRAMEDQMPFVISLRFAITADPI